MKIVNNVLVVFIFLMTAIVNLQANSVGERIEKDSDVFSNKPIVQVGFEVAFFDVILPEILKTELPEEAEREIKKLRDQFLQADKLCLWLGMYDKGLGIEIQELLTGMERGAEEGKKFNQERRDELDKLGGLVACADSFKRVKDFLCGEFEALKKKSFKFEGDDKAIEMLFQSFCAKEDKVDL